MDKPFKQQIEKITRRYNINETGGKNFIYLPTVLKLTDNLIKQIKKMKNTPMKTRWGSITTSKEESYNQAIDDVLKILKGEGDS
jgi:predicted metal-dependent hydrolase